MVLLTDMGITCWLTPPPHAFLPYPRCYATTTFLPFDCLPPLSPLPYSALCHVPYLFGSFFCRTFASFDACNLPWQFPCLYLMTLCHQALHFPFPPALFPQTFCLVLYTYIVGDTSCHVYSPLTLYCLYNPFAGPYIGPITTYLVVLLPHYRCGTPHHALYWLLCCTTTLSPHYLLPFPGSPGHHSYLTCNYLTCSLTPCPTL